MKVGTDFAYKLCLPYPVVGQPIDNEDKTASQFYFGFVFLFYGEQSLY